MNLSIFTPHTIESLKAGGMEIYLENLIKGLKERGHKIIINKISHDTELVLSQEFSFQNSSDYSKKIPCITIMHGVSKNLVRNIMNSRGKIFYIPALLYQKYLDIRNKAKKNLKNSHRIIAVSNHIKKFLIEDYKLDPEKITVIHNGIDASFFLPKKRLLNKKKKILYVSRLSKSKGIEKLLNINKGLKGEVIVVGSGYLEKKLKTKYQNNKNIKFVGQKTQKELLSYYVSSDVLVFPSLCCEGCPMTILEAMSCELPIIATDLCGNKEIIKDGETGIFWNKENGEEDLLKKINYLLNNEKSAKEIGENARKDVLKRFTYKLTTKKVLDVIENLRKSN